MSTTILYKWPINLHGLLLDRVLSGRAPKFRIFTLTHTYTHAQKKMKQITNKQRFAHRTDPSTVPNTKRTSVYSHNSSSKAVGPATRYWQSHKALVTFGFVRFRACGYVRGGTARSKEDRSGHSATTVSLVQLIRFLHHSRNLFSHPRKKGKTEMYGADILPKSHSSGFPAENWRTD